MTRLLLGLLLSLTLASTAAQAQGVLEDSPAHEDSHADAGTGVSDDPVVVGPDIYHVVFENERVRVSEIHFVPGASIAMHSHPDHFVYVLSPGTLQLSYPDGRTQDFVAEPGQVVWMQAETHAGVNIGETDVRALVVELKD